MVNSDLIKDTSELISYLSKLSRLEGIITDKEQLYNIFDDLFHDFCLLFNAHSSFIQFQLPTKSFSTNVFRRAISLPMEYCININDNVLNMNKSILDDGIQYIYDLTNLSNDRIMSGIKQLGLKCIVSVPILGTDRSIAMVNLYYDTLIDINPSIISSIRTIADILSSSFIHKLQVNFNEQRINDRSEYFMETFDIIFVLDEHYNIIDTNKRGMTFLGNKMLNTELSITSCFLNNTDIETFYQFIRSTDIESYSTNEEIFTLKSPISSEQLVVTMGMKKREIYNSVQYIISSRILPEEIEIKDNQSSLGEVTSILPLLNEFKDLYRVNMELAIENYKKLFFPAAFVFSVNEISGPMLLRSSPNFDQSSELVLEMVKLIAGLNSAQLLENNYNFGSTPWSNPPGDLYWIAFTVENENARGKIETHAIGIVVKNNLINATPSLLQSLKGSLMGSMNDFISILVEDEADFITSSFDNDRNFSTLTLISESLNYLRHIAIELLGTHSYEYTF